MEAIWDALAAAKSAPAIDVERLNRALDNLWEARWGPSKMKGQTTVNLEYAEAIAAEYAKLGASSKGAE